MGVTSRGYQKGSQDSKTIHRFPGNSRVLSLCSSEKCFYILRRYHPLEQCNPNTFCCWYRKTFLVAVAQRSSPYLPPVAGKGKSTSRGRVKMLLTGRAPGEAGCTRALPDLCSLIASRRTETMVSTNCIAWNVLLQRTLCLIFLLPVPTANEKGPS